MSALSVSDLIATGSFHEAVERMQHLCRIQDPEAPVDADAIRARYEANSHAPEGRRTTRAVPGCSRGGGPMSARAGQKTIRTLAVCSTVLASLSLLGIIAAGFIAIWHPWGHNDQWSSTAALLLFPTFIFGAAASFLWLDVQP